MYETILYGGEDAGQLVRVTGMTVSVKGGAVVELGFHVAKDFDGRSKYREAVSDATTDCGNMADARSRNHDTPLHPMVAKSTTARGTRTISVPAASSPSSSRDIPHNSSAGNRLSDGVFLGNQIASANDTKATLEFPIDGRAGERVVKIDVVEVSYDEENADAESDGTDGGNEPAIGALRVSVCSFAPELIAQIEWDS